MKQRVITAVIAAALFIPVVTFGSWLLQVVMSILAGIAVYEFYRMSGNSFGTPISILTIIGAVAWILPISQWLPFISDPSSVYYFVVAIMLIITVFFNDTYSIDDIAFPVLVSLYVGKGFGSFVSSREGGLVIIFYALFVVWLTDIGAYLIGRRYGAHKLAPSVSPNKTIEGSLGGVLCAVVFALVYFLFYPTKTYFPYGLVAMLVLTIVFSIGGQMGDLVESAYKRHYGVKDSGNILPGHGGILDRFDSILFVFPLMSLFNLF